MSTTFKIGKIFGIEIGVHWSWVFIFALITWSVAESVLTEFFPEWSSSQRWVVGVVVAIIFFASILLHELSHSLVAKAKGIPVNGITLFVFGGVSNLGREAQTAGEEFQIAIVGPLTSLAIGVAFAIAWAALRGAAPEVSAIAGYLALINGAIAAFNMLPGFPLDGGRVFRSIVWARTNDLLRATRIASRVGVGIAYGMIAVGLVSVFFFGLFGGLWYVLIGLFLKAASEGSYATLRVESALKDVHVAAVMRPAPEPVHAALALQRLIDERLLATAERAFLIERDGAIAGLITATDIAKVPRERWAGTRVEEAMVPAEQVVTVTPDTGLVEAMRLIQQHDVDQLPVIDDGRIVGMLTRGDVMRHIELRTVFRDTGKKPDERA